MDEKANRRSTTGKVYYQISEVAQLTGVNESTLRNWEEQYDELRNVRRINNRRHYTVADIASIQRISEKRSNKPTPTEEAEAEVPHKEVTKPVDRTSTISEHSTMTPKQIKELVKSLREVRKEIQKIATELA